MRLALFIPIVLSSACASTPEAPVSVSGAQESVERLSAEIVDLASRRVDLNTVRAAIMPFRGEGASAAAAGAPRDPVDAELRREFELALANRLHLVEPSWTESQPSELGAATHALVGDYTVRDGMLVLSVRLVELESRLVLSAARDELPVTWFSPKAVAQLTPPPPLPAIRPSTSPGTTTSMSTTTARPAAATTSHQIEDFQTWRARRMAEQAAETSKPAAGSVTEQSTSPPAAPPKPEGPSGSSSVPPVQGPSVSYRPSAGVKPPQSPRFPWHENETLAELLGVPVEERDR